MKLLLKKGANVLSENHMGISPIVAASLNGHLQVVKELVKNGAAVDGGRHGYLNDFWLKKVLVITLAKN